MADTLTYRVCIRRVDPALVLAAATNDGSFSVILPVREADPNDGWQELLLTAEQFFREYRLVSDDERELVGL